MSDTVIYEYEKAFGISRNKALNFCDYKRYFTREGSHKRSLEIRKDTSIYLDNVYGFINGKKTDSKRIFVTLKDDVEAKNCFLLLINAYLYYCESIGAEPVYYFYNGLHKDSEHNVNIEVESEIEN